MEFSIDHHMDIVHRKMTAATYRETSKKPAPECIRPETKGSGSPSRQDKANSSQKLHIRSYNNRSAAVADDCCGD